MALRTVALCNGKLIGIESIYTVINGKQINIPEKIKDLRAKSRNKEFFCPCGCGANLTLIAGDRNLREQHFRIKKGAHISECDYVSEGKTSVNSKIILKCWLDDKSGASDIESRVPINAVDDINRKYEFTFLSQEKKLAISYSHKRANLTDEKFDILEENSQGIHIIYIVDTKNGGCSGQYPEWMMKVQDKQGYCLLLSAGEADYDEAKMEAVFYAQDIDGLWREMSFASGLLKVFEIGNNGLIYIEGESLTDKLVKAQSEFATVIEREKIRREENYKRFLEERNRREEQERIRREEAEKERQRQFEEAAKRKAALEENRRLEEERLQNEKRQREEDFKRNWESDFAQQDTQIIDAEGNRWIKCEICGKKSKEDEFTSRGGVGRVNLGICKECYGSEEHMLKLRNEAQATSSRKKYDPNICPWCGGKLREKNGEYGRFIGCSNYSKCNYSRNIRCKW